MSDLLGAVTEVKRAIIALDKIVSSFSNPMKRVNFDKLPANEDAKVEWAFYVPKVFDIALGFNNNINGCPQTKFFSFSTGDVIYNKKTIKGKWKSELGGFTESIQIDYATSNTMYKDGELSKIMPGKVKFSIYKSFTQNMKKKIKLVEQLTLPQHKFIEFLITGERK